LRWWWPARRAVLIGSRAILLLFGLLLAPLGLPVLPPHLLARYGATVHLVPQIEEGAGKRAALPQWFADRLGWEQLVTEVAAARDRVPPAERSKLVYFAPSYGQASALDWLGSRQGLGPVYCTHNSWYLWGPPAGPTDVAIVLGEDYGHLLQIFEEVNLAGIYTGDLCMPWRNEMPIWIVRRAREPIAQFWSGWRHFE
jgi:hypothetical protein